METLKTSTDTLFILLGAVMVLAMHGGFAFLELGTVRQQEPGQCAGEDPGRFRHLDGRLFLHRLHHRLRHRRSSSAREALAQKSGYELVQVLLPAHLRRRDAGDRLGRHRRARQVQSAVCRDRRAGRACLSVLRRHRLERALRRAGVDQGHVRRRVPRLRRLASSCTPWAAGSRWPPCCCSARGSAATQGRRASAASAVVDPVARAGRVDAVRSAGSAST